MTIKKTIITFQSVLVWLILGFPLSSCEPVEDTQRTLVWTKSGKIGYRNSRGVLVIDTLFRQIDTAYYENVFVKTNSHFTPCGVSIVRDDTGVVIIDRQGNRLYRPFIIENRIDNFREGLARMKSGDKCGYFDTCGKIAIPAQFKFAENFFENRAGFCYTCSIEKDHEYTRVVGGTWGFINKRGEIVIPPEFDGVGDFKNGSARARKGDEIFYIDTNGVRTNQIVIENSDPYE
jgi:hypothetical protein